MARSGNKTLIWWLLGMFFIPPILGFLTGAMSGGSQWGMQAVIVVYAISMIAMGIAAAMDVAQGPARAGLAILFVVGMVFVQCAAFFVGCSLLVGNI